MGDADALQGPMVGERQSSSAIATEYANADPVYRVKTAALPSKYAYFRTCRGDGHCGWRGTFPAASSPAAAHHPYRCAVLYCTLLCYTNQCVQPSPSPTMRP